MIPALCPIPKSGEWDRGGIGGSTRGKEDSMNEITNSTDDQVLAEHTAAI
jgi:hypothetical protein